MEANNEIKASLSNNNNNNRYEVNPLTRNSQTHLTAFSTILKHPQWIFCTLADVCPTRTLIVGVNTCT